VKFQKIISVILHPIVLPTIGTILYFLFVPNRIEQNQRLIILGLIFVSTYLIPLLILILLKTFKAIKSFQVHTIKERKLPVFIITILFYILGSTLSSVSILSDLGMLFYASSYALVIVYILFSFDLKTSLHTLSIGISLSFFLVMGISYSISLLPIIMILIFLSGVLASSRLHLKAHTVTEVYLGFTLGVISPFLVFYFL
jgi:hypothetical protein